MFTSYKQLLVELEAHFTIMPERILVRSVLLTSPAIPSLCVHKIVCKLVTLSKFIYRICTALLRNLNYFHAKYSLSVRTLRMIIRFSRSFGTALCLLLRGNGNWLGWMLHNLSNQHSIWTTKNNTAAKAMYQLQKFEVLVMVKVFIMTTCSVRLYCHKPGEKKPNWKSIWTSV
jgi:hypothetical protein